MLTLAPLVLARDCFRADAVGPPATETAATTWSLADCTTLDFSCTGNSSVPAAESGKLCENALQADEVASLTEALKSDAPNLVSLELRGNWVGPLKGAALATALQAHPSLEFLGLASTALGDVGGTALARRLLLQDAPPALRRIDLSHNHLGDDCARALAESLKAEDGLPLSSLDLSWNGIGPRGGRYLGDALKVNDALLELRLRWNGLQDRGARALGEGLALNRVLGALQLQHNAIKDAGGKALAAGLRNNSALRALEVEHNGISPTVSEQLRAALELQPALPPLAPRRERGSAAAQAEPAVYTRDSAAAEADDGDVEEISFDDDGEKEEL